MRSRCQPGVPITSVAAGAAARIAATVAVSRSTSGSQDGAGSRLAIPSSPDGSPAAGAAATGRVVSGRSSFAISMPGRSGASAAMIAACSNPSAVGGVEDRADGELRQRVHPHGRPGDRGGEVAVGLDHRERRLDLGERGQKIDDVVGERAPPVAPDPAPGGVQDGAMQGYDDDAAGHASILVDRGAGDRGDPFEVAAGALGLRIAADQRPELGVVAGTTRWTSSCRTT